jgi:hypothetical protein
VLACYPARHRCDAKSNEEVRRTVRTERTHIRAVAANVESS